MVGRAILRGIGSRRSIASSQSILHELCSAGIGSRRSIASSQSILRLTPRLQVVVPQLYRDLGQLGRQVQADHLDALWDASWQRYTRITPDAVTVQRLLGEKGERIVNDHVAIRTFNLPGINRRVLGDLFQPLGYIRAPETLEFPEKHLLADYYIHPDARQPKVFISELLLEEMSPLLRGWIEKLVAQLPHQSGRNWGRAEHYRLLLDRTWAPVSFADYRRFYQESEYAAWVAAYGLRINHFTVFGNHLKGFAGIAGFNEFLKERGLLLNGAGGEIKGSAGSFLEQSSTMARRVPVRFQEGLCLVPGGYYEFAWRHPLPPQRAAEELGGDGSDEEPDGGGGRVDLFQGFIPESANRIFESTGSGSGRGCASTALAAADQK